MSKAKDILGLPVYIENVGDCYSVKVKDYDEFVEHASIFTVTEAHFNKNALKEFIGEGFKSEDFKLLDLILISASQFGGQEALINTFVESFEYTFRTTNIQFRINESFQGFIINNKGVIDRNNYNEVRKIILKQNALFEQKVFKNKLVQEWAESVLKARSKNGVKITMESKINLVHILTGIPYKKLANQTIYQLEKDFERICRLKDFDVSILFQTVSTEKIDINHYAEHIEFKNPYDDVFKNGNKLTKLNNTVD